MCVFLNKSVCQEKLSLKLRKKEFRAHGIAEKKIEKGIWSKQRWLPEMCEHQDRTEPQE